MKKTSKKTQHSDAKSLEIKKIIRKIRKLTKGLNEEKKVSQNIKPPATKQSALAAIENTIIKLEKKPLKEVTDWQYHFVLQAIKSFEEANDELYNVLSETKLKKHKDHSYQIAISAAEFVFGNHHHLRNKSPEHVKRPIFSEIRSRVGLEQVKENAWSFCTGLPLKMLDFAKGLFVWPNLKR